MNTISKYNAQQRLDKRALNKDTKYSMCVGVSLHMSHAVVNVVVVYLIAILHFSKNKYFLSKIS